MVSVSGRSGGPTSTPQQPLLGVLAHLEGPSNAGKDTPHCRRLVIAYEWECRKGGMTRVEFQKQKGVNKTQLERFLKENEVWKLRVILQPIRQNLDKTPEVRFYLVRFRF
jgi:hypothetical protein